MNKVNELYDKLETREKRLVMRLLRALTNGPFDEGEIGKICRIINRQTGKERKKKTGYILFYTQQYPKVRAKNNDFPLGKIAQTIAKKWNTLTAIEKQKYNKLAKES